MNSTHLYSHLTSFENSSKKKVRISIQVFNPKPNDMLILNGKDNFSFLSEQNDKKYAKMNEFQVNKERPAALSNLCNNCDKVDYEQLEHEKMLLD